MRSCSKTACGREARASCTFSYAERVVWLVGLRRDPDPNFYDLCEPHAHALRVPRGWALEDQRVVSPPPAAVPLLGAEAPLAG